MERIVCQCKKCGARLGEFVNLWTRIGKAYFSPVVSGPRDTWNLESHGEEREGEQSTLVEKWSVCSILDTSRNSFLTQYTPVVSRMLHAAVVEASSVSNA